MAVLICILVSFRVFAAEGIPVKAGQSIGTVVQTESPERLKQFPVTTMRRHKLTLKPSELTNDKIQFGIDPRAVSWGFRLHFRGEIRAINGLRKEFLNMVGQQQSGFADHYKQEIKVTDGDEEFWLPIQENIVADFNKEIKKNDLFFAQTRYFGNYYDSKPIQFFLLIDFQQIPKAP